MRKIRIKLFLSFALLLSISQFSGLGCSNGFKANFSSSSSSLDATNPIDDGGLVVFDNTKTTSLVFSQQVLMNFKSVLGVNECDSADDLWEDKKGIFSEQGLANSLNAPMQFAMTSLAGEVCGCLIDQELASDSKRIFKEINLSTQEGEYQVTDFQPAINRLVRSAWSRNESEEELSLLLQSLPADEISADEAGLFLCTAIMASLESVEL